MKLDSASMEKILMNLTIAEIIRFLKGSSEELRNFILSNIKGPATKSLIAYELEHAVIGESEIAEAQEKMFNLIQKLWESGGIYTGIFGSL